MATTVHRFVARCHMSTDWSRLPQKLPITICGQPPHKYRFVAGYNLSPNSRPAITGVPIELPGELPVGLPADLPVEIPVGYQVSYQVATS